METRPSSAEKSLSKMAHIESILVTDQPLEKVFAFLDACESHRKFIPRMTALRQSSPGAFGQTGTRLSGMLNYFGVRIPVRYELIDVKRNDRLAMKGQMGPIGFQDGYVLRRTGEGTEIQFWLDITPTGWTKVFSPFMGCIGKIHAWETLRNLKRELANYEMASVKRAASQ